MKNLKKKIAGGLAAALLLSPAYATERLTYEDLPKYSKNSIGQGPAAVYTEKGGMSTFLRILDTNSDAYREGYKTKGADIFEYNMCETKDGIKLIPYLLIMDTDYNGVADTMYHLNEDDQGRYYEKYDLSKKNLVMDDFESTKIYLEELKN